MSTARLPIIDTKGNISLHGMEDLQLSVRFQGDNVENSVLYFHIEGQTPILVPPTGGDPQIRVIKVPQAVIAKIPPEGANYALRDETMFPHFVRLDGKIRWYGWTK